MSCACTPIRAGWLCAPSILHGKCPARTSNGWANLSVTLLARSPHRRSEMGIVLNDFADRHWQLERVFDDRYKQIEFALKLDGGAIKRHTKRLIGAYFCHEYSYAAAALMNPIVVRHPDQSGLQTWQRAAS